MKKKKIILISSIALAVVLAVGLGIWKLAFSGNSTGSDSAAYVQSVAEISGLGSLGLDNRFSGLVEPQKEVKVNKDDNKTVAKVNVSEGDNVKAGDVLFEYDIDEMKLQLDQLKLELEGINNKISTLNEQLTELNKQKNNAGSNEQLDYTLQIQSTELDIKTEQYNASQKSAEISKAEKSIGNSQVKSEIDGVIKSINRDGNSGGTDNSYITVLSTGNFRIKAVATELSVNSLSVGEKMTIRSRVDNSTWAGTISSIDREAASNNNQNVYYTGAGDESTQASKYNFYIELENFDGLMLGQHVYAELGEEQKTSGVMLPSYYIVTDNGSSYIWLAKDGKLRKQNVELGAYNENSDMQEIKSGLSATDKVAYPEERLHDGMAVTEEMPVPEDSDSSALFTETGGDAETAMNGNDVFSAESAVTE